MTGDFDPEYTRRCFEENLRFLAEDYFRASLIGAEHFPIGEVGRRAIIMVSNHAGMGLSWDNIILDFLIYDRLRQAVGEAAVQRKAVRLVDPLLIQRATVRPFGIDRWWSRTGCVEATFANFEQSVRERRIVCVSPEGIGGVSKGFHRRYRLQRYSSSFLHLARTHGALVVPVSIVNSEFVQPLSLCWAPLNRLGRRLGFPFLPLGLGSLQLLFPATYLTAFPAHLTYVFHPPVDYARQAAPPDRAALRAEAETFREAQQQRLDAAMREHADPFDLASLRQRFRASPRRRMMFPFFWHEMFLKTAGAPAIIQVLQKLPLAYPLLWFAKRLWWPDLKSPRNAPASEGALNR